MPNLVVDKMVDEFMGERLDAEVAAIMGTATKLIKDGDIVPKHEQNIAIIDLIRHLEKQETEWKSNNNEKGRLPPAYRTMKMFTVEKDMNLLKLYLKTLIKESKGDEAGRQQWIESHKRRFLPQSEDEQPTELPENEAFSKVILPLTHAIKWALKEAPEVIEGVLKMRFMPVVDELVQGFIPSGGFATMMVVSGVYVGIVVLSNLYCVAFRGRSWKRAVKKGVDEGASITVGNVIGFGVAATAGLVFASLPTAGFLAISALVGLAASFIARKYFQKWTLKWFGLSENEKLEKAYNLFEVRPTDSNSVVNRVYREKSRTCHPDKLAGLEPMPSKVEMQKKINLFLEYQDAIKTIRDAREMDGNGVDNQDEQEILWRTKVVNFLKRLNPWWGTTDKKMSELLALTYDFPPISIFEDESLQPEAR